MATLIAALLLLLAVEAAAAAAPAPAPACSSSPTSLACLCATIGAVVVQGPPQAPAPPHCRLWLEQQGGRRFADVYLPARFNASDASASAATPLWLQLHGYFKPHWSRPDAPENGGLDHVVRGAEGQAAGWGIVAGRLGGAAIHVYPDAGGGGASGRPQFWNSGFWQQPWGNCMDEGVDDVGFLEALTQRLLERLPAPPKQVFLMGYSNGGMMATALLCRSAFFRRTLSAAALVSSALARDHLATSCPPDMPPAATPAGGGQAASGSGADARAPPRVPLVFISGMRDHLFLFNATSSSGGAELHSTLGMVDAWAAKYGCDGSNGSSAAGTAGRAGAAGTADAAGSPAVAAAASGAVAAAVGAPPHAAAKGTRHRRSLLLRASSRGVKASSTTAAGAHTSSSTTSSSSADGGQRPPVVFLSGKASCRSYCLSAAGAPPLWLCPLPGTGHEWQAATADIAWSFFTRRDAFTTPLTEPANAWQPLSPGSSRSEDFSSSNKSSSSSCGKSAAAGPAAGTGSAVAPARPAPAAAAAQQAAPQPAAAAGAAHQQPAKAASAAAPAGSGLQGTAAATQASGSRGRSPAASSPR